jgi:putative RNA 2'-phosphotransferase
MVAGTVSRTIEPAMSKLQKPSQIGRFLCLVLRHRPDTLGITLSSDGWVDISILLKALNGHGTPLDAASLAEIVASDDKQRFAVSENGLRIRANQGHSLPVQLDYKPQAPPENLFHGTPTRFLNSIRANGLIKGQRHHVHLSADTATARKVGERRGTAAILKIRASEMHAQSFLFYQSDNGVWLTDHVPVEFIDFSGAFA